MQAAISRTHSRLEKVVIAFPAQGAGQRQLPMVASYCHLAAKARTMQVIGLVSSGGEMRRSLIVNA